MVIRAVVFDVGETLLDDSREWRAWADWVGVSPHTFSTVLGAVTAAGRDNAETFEYSFCSRATTTAASSGFLTLPST